MNFERNIGTKESLRIGRKYKAYKVKYIEIHLIPDDKEFKEEFYTTIEGNDGHEFLSILQNKKIPWKVLKNYDYGFFTGLENRINQTLSFKLNFHFIAPKGMIPRGSDPYPGLSLRKMQGRDILYENKLYAIPFIYKNKD